MVLHALTFEDQSIRDRTWNVKLPLGVLALAERGALKTEESSDGFASSLARDLRERARPRFEAAVAVIAGRIGPEITLSERAVVPNEPWDKTIRGRQLLSAATRRVV
jgi:hypothetical protein